jgi:hypothetical protein
MSDRKEPTILPPQGSPGDYAVLIPCSQDAFAKFVSGLLGQTQTIQRRIEGPYEVHRSDIKKIYDLLMQRVRQNESSLASFGLTVYYDDRSSVKFNSYEDFNSYAEIRPRSSIGFDLSFNFLVKFTDREVPEKQVINVTFRAPMVVRGPELLFEMGDSPWYDTDFKIRIEHTDRSWGVDIENLLSGHIETIKKNEPSKLQSYLSKRAGRFALSAGVICFAVFAAGFFLTIGRYGDERISHFRDSLSTLSGYERVSTSLDILGGYLLAADMPNFVAVILIFFVMAIVISIVFGAFIGDKLTVRPKGFLVLTRQAETARDEHLASARKYWVVLFFGVLSGLTSGVVSNLIFWGISGYFKLSG